MKKIYLTIGAIAAFSITSCSSTKPSQTNDGLSYETAIKVKSVDQEYQLLPKLCPDCKLKSQGLSSKGSKKYDVMTMVKPNGEIVAYYFDITSFFGRF